jgi:hypothetical protein
MSRFRAPTPPAPHLAAETALPLAEQLNRSLLMQQHFYAVGTAMREAAVASGARIFFYTHNLHLSRNSRDFALKTAAESVCAMGSCFWRQGGGEGSFLGKAAHGCRPLLAAVPEQDTFGSWHVHGFLLVPACIAAGKGELEERLRELPNHVCLERGSRLRGDAVDLEPVNGWEYLKRYAQYATDSWNELPPGDRCIDFAPHGRHASKDWEPLMLRAASILEEQALVRRGAAHRRAVRTDRLLEQGSRARREKSAKVAGGAGGRPAAKPYREIAVPPEPSRAANLPADGATTGWVNW